MSASETIGHPSHASENPRRSRLLRNHLGKVRSFRMNRITSRSGRRPSDRTARLDRRGPWQGVRDRHAGPGDQEGAGASLRGRTTGDQVSSHGFLGGDGERLDGQAYQYGLLRGRHYPTRALVALVGLGANLPQDAIYPMTTVDGEGKSLTGANRYVIHFDKDRIPPTNAFWSVTMYDMQRFFVANPIDRYAIGDRDTLKFNDDGSLDLFIQHDSPGRERESNWLPAPKGECNLIMRLYWPKASMLDGLWKVPPVQRLP